MGGDPGLREPITMTSNSSLLLIARISSRTLPKTTRVWIRVMGMANSRATRAFFLRLFFHIGFKLTNIRRKTAQ